MNIKKHKNLILLALLAAGLFVAYIWFMRQPVFEGFIGWSQQNFLLYFSVLVFIKIIAIVWPPLPGGLLTFASVPIIGWFPAFLAETIGGLAGSSVAYYLGKKYGYAFLRKVLDEKFITRIQRIKIAGKKELEAIFFLRLFTGLISEAVSYGSGVIGVKYRNFFLGTLAAEIVFMPTFYFFNEIIAGRNLAIYAPVALILALVFWRMRGRYFE
ncbi:MAG: VTT domain-containing protein [Candidatus Spechtbacterales bacterium]